MFKAIYLPVDKPIEDGCDVINESGQNWIYRASDCWDLKRIRRAEMFLVSYDFNIMKIIGKPTNTAMRMFIKPGMEIRENDCIASPNMDDDIALYNVKCPVCGVLH